ncbi:hypothetical protein DH2020_021747 [Rehmannia glutinosa]|uniref:ACT domain-containing protein n=1 Tax=Rehmannia glutinosa TaxID=99300 RepID=A0ABR0WF50_REHGL
MATTAVSQCPITGGAKHKNPPHSSILTSRVQFGSINFRPHKQLLLAHAAANGGSSENGAAVSVTQNPSPSPPQPPAANSRAKRHTISVFVGDESGIINRIAGVFARRGYNIESLAVGLNKDKALFTIVVSGTEKVLQQVVEQLNKLVNVLKVEDLSKEPQVERELMLIKVNADSNTKSEPPGASSAGKRPAMGHQGPGFETYQLQLLLMSPGARRCGASLPPSLVAVGGLKGPCHSEFSVTGDPGKMAAVLRNLKKFGIKELARTGKIALRREKMGETAPFWRFSAASYPDLEGTVPIEASNTASKQVIDKCTNGKLTATSGGDVYPVEPDDGFYNKVLDAHWGVLYDEDSLAVGPAEQEGLSRITTVVPGTDESIGKLVQQFYKLVDVHEVQDITHLPFAERELMLIKIAANAAARRDVLDIANIFRAKPVDVSDHTVTLEMTGDFNKMLALQNLLEPYGICEVGLFPVSVWCYSIPP